MTTKQPAAEGGTPVRDEFLPFARPCIEATDIDLVVETLRSGWLTVGPKTHEFQRRVASYVGVEAAAALNSCTAGLHLAMVVLGVGPGDEVVLPTIDFASGANTVCHLGATPVLVDVDPETLCVTPEILEQAITERTRVLMPVHFAGRPCDMDGIMELARAKGVKVLGDAAHAIGADIGGRKIGSMADVTSFSFYVTKGITTGEGGAVTSTDPDLTARIALLGLHGMSSDAWKRYSDRGPWYYEVLDAGYKYNMSDMQAALGLSQLDRVDAFRERRREIAEAFTASFAADAAITPPPPFTEGRHAWHLYPIQIDVDALTIGRDQFIRHLLEEGIGVSVHFIPIHFHPYYRELLGLTPGSLPVAENYFARAISLPIYPSMTESDVNDVIEAVEKLTSYYRR